MNRAPNPAVNRTAHKLQLWYPSALARAGALWRPITSTLFSEKLTVDYLPSHHSLAFRNILSHGDIFTKFFTCLSTALKTFIASLSFFSLTSLTNLLDDLHLSPLCAKFSADSKPVGGVLWRHAF